MSRKKILRRIRAKKRILSVYENLSFWQMSIMNNRAASEEVSVLIISYGNYSGLERTVESVLQQSYPIHEIILSDDGSGKPFPEHVLTRLKSAPCNVIVREGPVNLGTTAHLNQIAGLSCGTYLKFMSAGDAFADSESLSSLVSFARQCNTMVVCSNTAVCSHDLKKKYYDFPGSARGAKLQCAGYALFSVLAKVNSVSAIGTLLHRSFFEYGGFDESYRLLEDWPAWLRLAKNGGKIPFLDRVTCLHAAGGVSTRNSDAFCSEALRSDMIHCYEQELLPELTKLPPQIQREVRYRYEALTRNRKRVLITKYLDLYARDMLKRKLKQLIQGSRSTQGIIPGG